MFEELGISEAEFNKLNEELSLTDDPVLTIAKSSIDLSRAKETFSKIRYELVESSIFYLSLLLHENYKAEDKELIQRLNKADDEEFKKLISLVKAYLIDVIPKPSSTEQKVLSKFNFSIEVIFSYFNESVKEYLCRAAACILSDIPEAAIANIEMAILKSIEAMNMNKAADSILIKKGEAKRATEASLASNKKRHAKSHLVREYAIKLYNEGNFPSVRNAAQRIAQQVMDYAHNDEALNNLEGTPKRFSDIFSAADTIERWIGNYKRAERKDK